MADQATTTDPAKTDGQTSAPETPVAKADGNGTTDTGAGVLVEKLTGLQKSIDDSNNKFDERIEKLEDGLKNANQAIYPYGVPDGEGGEGVHGVRTGESPMTSRPYSMMFLAKRVRMQKANVPGWEDIGKPEAELSDKLKKYYGGAGWKGFNSHETIMPLSVELMPQEDGQTEEGHEIQAVPATLRKQCRDMMNWQQDVDFDHLAWIEKKTGVQLAKSATYAAIQLAKDMSAQQANIGGTLVAQAAQGELIGILRASEVWGRVGATMVDLPPQGSIRYPRINSTVTVSATSENQTIAESTPGTGGLLLQAKPYVTLVDIPEELFKFASVSVEAWLRTEMTRETALKTDRDTFNGAGGIAIHGLLNYPNIVTRIAGTPGGNGDTLDAPDPMLLFGDIADNNAPVDSGFFYAMTNSLWAGLITRQATTDEFIFNVGTQSAGGGRAGKSLNGELVVGTTQVPRDRTKGSGTALTAVVAGVGREMYIARSGVITIDMTNSDGTKFQNRVSTLRSTMFTDAGPLHQESFGTIDTLVNG